MNTSVTLVKTKRDGWRKVIRAMGSLARTVAVNVRFSPDEITKLDRVRGARSRSAYLRSLLAEVPELVEHPSPSDDSLFPAIRQAALLAILTSQITRLIVTHIAPAQIRQRLQTVHDEVARLAALLP